MKFAEKIIWSCLLTWECNIKCVNRGSVSRVEDKGITIEK